MPMSFFRFPSVALLAFASLIIVLLPPQTSAQSVRTVLADGFDFPVGKPDADGYYKARGYRPHGHLGEDWNGRGGGNTDLGAPVYSIGHGVVVYSENYRRGWGNVVIIRHAYRARNGRVQCVDSLYGHLHERYVGLHDRVRRGQPIGTIGNNGGMYWAHLHLELRKNLEIGLNRSDFERDNRNYHCPTTFIRAHRSLPQDSRYVKVPSLRESRDPDFPEEPGREVRHVNPFLVLHRIHRRPEDAREPVLLQSLRTEPAPDTPEAQEERNKIRAFWERFRQAASDSSA